MGHHRSQAQGEGTAPSTCKKCTPQSHRIHLRKPSNKTYNVSNSGYTRQGLCSRLCKVATPYFRISKQGPATINLHTTKHASLLQLVIVIHRCYATYSPHPVSLPRHLSVKYITLRGCSCQFSSAHVITLCAWPLIYNDSESVLAMHKSTGPGLCWSLGLRLAIWLRGPGHKL